MIRLLSVIMIVLLVLIPVAVLLVVLVVLRRRGKEDEDYASNALDFSLNLGLAVYLLVLAYAAVLAYDAIGAAETDAVAESESLTELYWAVAAIPEATPLRAQIREYTTQSIELDWPLMPTGELSPVPGETLDRIRTELVKLRPADDAGKEARSEAMSKAADVTHARALRADDASTSLDPTFLICMFLSGIVVIGLPWLAAAKPTFSSVVSDIVRVGVVVGGVLIILLIKSPYSGASAVEPDAFEAAQKQFDLIDRNLPA